MTIKPVLKTNSAAPISSNSIDPKLQHRLNLLRIPLDRTVIGAIANYHSSQVEAALNHVDANYELINSPKAVFLYQLPKQPIEHNQPLLPVYKASDFDGFTLQHLKAWYPHSWQSAAQHFGIPVDQTL